MVLLFVGLASGIPAAVWPGVETEGVSAISPVHTAVVRSPACSHIAAVGAGFGQIACLDFFLLIA